MLRRGLLWVAALTSAGIGVELAADRHWTTPIQLVAWGALAATGVAIALVAGASSAARVRLGRAVVVIVMFSAVLGIWEHVYSNYDAGELDFEYASTWEGLPEPDPLVAGGDEDCGAVAAAGAGGAGPGEPLCAAGDAPSPGARARRDRCRYGTGFRRINSSSWGRGFQSGWPRQRIVRPPMSSP